MDFASRVAQNLALTPTQVSKLRDELAAIPAERAEIIKHISYLTVNSNRRIPSQRYEYAICNVKDKKFQQSGCFCPPGTSDLSLTHKMATISSSIQ